MNKVFKESIELLEPLFQELMEMSPVTVPLLPIEMPSAGIYLFSEKETHLYVGRTNRIKKRLQEHCRPSSNCNQAVFAFSLARKITSITQATYKTSGSRKSLEQDTKFSKVFKEQKNRVRNMDVRFISELIPINQALLEIYVAISLNTQYNNFENH